MSRFSSCTFTLRAIEITTVVGCKKFDEQGEVRYGRFRITRVIRIVYRTTGNIAIERGR